MTQNEENEEEMIKGEDEWVQGKLNGIIDAEQDHWLQGENGCKEGERELEKTGHMAWNSCEDEEDELEEYDVEVLGNEQTEVEKEEEWEEEEEEGHAEEEREEECEEDVLEDQQSLEE